MNLLLLYVWVSSHVPRYVGCLHQSWNNIKACRVYNKFSLTHSVNYVVSNWWLLLVTTWPIVWGYWFCDVCKERKSQMGMRLLSVTRITMLSIIIYRTEFPSKNHFHFMSFSSVRVNCIKTVILFNFSVFFFFSFLLMDVVQLNQ